MNIIKCYKKISQEMMVKFLLSLFIVLFLFGCCECRPNISPRSSSRIDNRWEGPTICPFPIIGIKCKIKE